MKSAPRPYILVAPESQGGEFGPHTPGTRTSGLQEALDSPDVDNLRHPPRPVPHSPSPEIQTIHAPLFPGQTIHLEPGEKVQFTYTQPPSWRWKGNS